MHRDLGKGRQVYTAYIPSCFAKVGKTIGIKIKDEWEEGWVIDEAGPCRNIEDVNNSRENHKRFSWVLGD